MDRSHLSDPVTLPRPRRILVLGASGHCGGWLVRLAVARGHLVTALIRPESEYAPPDGVELIRGEVLEEAALEAAVERQEVVVSCLGLRRTNPYSPWARLLSPPDLTERVMARLVPLLERGGGGRLVAISAGGVGDSRKQATWVVRQLVGLGNVAVAYRDLERMEAILAQSRLDWLAVRPVTLMHGAPTGRAHRVDRYDVGSFIRRSDVAAWMLQAAEEPEPFSIRRVLLGSSRRIEPIPVRYKTPLPVSGRPAMPLGA